MSQINKRGLENNAVDGDKVGFLNEQWFRFRNFANDAWINIFKFSTDDELIFDVLPIYSGSSFATQSYVTAQLADYVPYEDVGAADGVCPLDSSGKVPSANLPSYVDDVLEYADLTALNLVTGESGKIYVTLDTGKTYRWSGSVYVEISPSDVNSVNGFTGVVVLTTTHISEGTNLYFTDTRAKTAAVVNSMAGSQTDQAPSVSSVKTYITANSDSGAVETFTLNSTDITNGYVDLAVEANAVLEVTPKGFPPQHPGDDYTISVVSSKTRITFAGTMLTLIAGDKLKVAYAY